MSHPSYEEFYAALADPSKRPLIGLLITDDDAWSLLENDEWARDYFDEWVALGEATDAAEPTPSDAVPAEVPAAEPGPVAEPQPAATPAAPPVLLVEPTPAPATADAGTPRPGPPHWAVAAIAGGAAVVLLAAVGVGALVYNAVTAAGGDAGASATPTPGADAADDLMPWDEGYVAPYSDSDAAKYLAIVEPLFGATPSGSASSGSATSDDLAQSYLLFGSSACVSLEAGFPEADIVGPIVDASAGKLTEAEGQTMIDAAKDYLCR